MKKKWNVRKDEEGVSPVIATILMVAITVVLAAVLYVMVMGIEPPDPSSTPMGLSKQYKDSTSISLLVASAPSTATVGATDIQINHNGVPTAITNATVYDGSANLAAWLDPGSGWNYTNGYDENSLKYVAGMSLIIRTDSLSNGDIITLSSTMNNFGTTTYKVT